MDNFLTKIINACVTCADGKLDCPFSVLLSVKDTKKVTKQILETLAKTREIASKQRCSSILQKYIMNKSEKINLSEEELISIIQILTTETPQTVSLEYIEDFCKCIELILSLIKNTSTAKVFNHIVSNPYPYSAVSLALLTKENTKYLAPALKFIMAVQSTPSPLSFYATSLFFTFHKAKELSDDVKKELRIDVFKTSLQAAFSLKQVHRLSAARLLKVLFKSLDANDSAALVAPLIPSIVTQLKEQNQDVRTELVNALCELPVSAGFLDVLLPAVAFRVDECDDSYGIAAIEFAFTRRTVQTLPAVLKSIIEAKETYTAGVLFSARLGLFEESDSLVQACFNDAPKPKTILSALQAICVLCKYNLLTEKLFKKVSKTITVALTSPTLLDDLLITCKAFKVLEELPEACSSFPVTYLDYIISDLSGIKEDDVVKKVAETSATLFEKKKEVIPSKVTPQFFALVFVPLAMKYLESEEDEEYQAAIVKLISILAASAHQKRVEMETSIANIVSTSVPDEYSDAVRTEAVLLMQTKPLAVMIAISLPNSAPFLPSLCRAVREANPPDLKLTKEFLQAGIKCNGTAFLPHLKKFAEPIEKTKQVFFVVSYTKKKKGYVSEVLDCIAYASKLKEAKEYIQELVQIVDYSFSITEDLSIIIDSALNAVTGILNAIDENAQDIQFPATLISSTFKCAEMSPIYSRMLKNVKNNEMVMIECAVDSFTKYLAVHPQFEQEETKAFVEACFALKDDVKVLSFFLHYVINFSSCDDPTPLIRLCLDAATDYRQSHASIELDLSEFVLGTSHYAISTSLPLRIALRDCILKLFGTVIPAETESPLLLAGTIISPNEIVQFASALFDIPSSQFTEEQSCKLSLLAASARPMQFHHALLVRSLAKNAARAIVSDQRQTLIHFLDGAKDASEDAFSLLLETCVLLFEGDKNTFTERFLSVPLSKFGHRLLEFFVRTSSYRDAFLESYGTVIANLKFPNIPSEQTDFLKAGYFQSLYVLVGVDAASDALRETFGQHVAHCISWLSLLFAARQTLPKQVCKELLAKLISCLERIFARVGRSSREPIELSLKSTKKLFFTLGTLANALMMVDFTLLVDFCRALFPLLRATIPQTVLTAGMVIARLLSRVSSYDSEAAKLLLPKLRESLAYGFSTAGDENCRMLSALTGELMQRSSLEVFTEQDKQKLIAGGLRGLSFPGDELRAENIAFVCKVARVISKESLKQYYTAVWDYALSSHSFETISVLVSMDPSPEKMPTDLIAEAIVATTDASFVCSRECSEIVFAMCGAKDINGVVLAIDKVFADRAQAIRQEVLRRITKGNATMAGLDLIIELTENDEEGRQKAINLLLSIVEDADHVLRQKAASLLSVVLSK